MSRPFLTARWENLILATYAVPEELLFRHVPPGLELDRYDGKCYVSLVPFQFRNTRVFGVGWPGFQSFPELNLRFYVRSGERRGVCFLREYVPKWFVAWVARRIYNEPYRTARMSVDVAEKPDRISASYSTTVGGRLNRVWALGSTNAVRPKPESTEHFFKEHQWGFGKTRGGALLTYEVRHPVWDVYPVIDYGIDVNWEEMYGREWAMMQDRVPDFVFFAAGSEVAVYPKQPLHDPRPVMPLEPRADRVRE
ncbi:MAG TPA: DUF2071 domain-containing protein [Fimbriiglobus sp.]|jgi:hypothetical protein